MQRIDQLVGLLAGFVEQTGVSRIAFVGRSTSGIEDQLATGGGCTRSVGRSTGVAARASVVITWSVLIVRLLRKRCQAKRLGDPLHYFLAKPFSKVDHQGRSKRFVLGRIFQTDQ